VSPDSHTAGCIRARRLVKEGIIMDRQYTFKYCSPTRSSFLSGRLPYHVNQANRAYSAVGGVDIRMTMISEHLKSAGYGTHMIGVSQPARPAQPSPASHRTSQRAVELLL
jgi:arylsulfatase A-like enzyme